MDKSKRRERRRSARKHKVSCPCGRVGCETGRGIEVFASVLRRREVRRGGISD